jgi:hypothetical protein
MDDVAVVVVVMMSVSLFAINGSPLLHSTVAGS